MLPLRVAVFCVPGERLLVELSSWGCLLTWRDSCLADDGLFFLGLLFSRALLIVFVSVL